MIRNWRDVTEFAGKVVHFNTDIYYFLGTRQMADRYALVSFGVSDWIGGEVGHNMSILKNKGEVAGNRALIDSMLSHGQLTMRLAQEEELKEVVALLDSGTMSFEYQSNSVMLKKIQGQGQE